MRIRIGHSPDADDAFAHWAYAVGRLPPAAARYEFTEVIEDIERLNERALDGELEVTAISLFAYARAAGRYRLLSSGASFGEGYGPVVVARTADGPADLAGTDVAVPGRLTTAALLLRLFAPASRPVEMPFDQILPAVAEGRIPAGVLIHEGQLTYAREGLRLALDLALAWTARTNLPLPLGFNAIRRDLPENVRRDLASLHRAAVRAALENREDALARARPFAKGLDAAEADRFVGMYVNARSLDPGPDGRLAMRTLLDWAAAEGLAPAGVPLDFQEEA
ncbi:MAG: MqnA/MqnD/SBP family protein [Planctomycetota bacterium]